MRWIRALARAALLYGGILAVMSGVVWFYYGTDFLLAAIRDIKAVRWELVLLAGLILFYAIRDALKERQPGKP